MEINIDAELLDCFASHCEEYNIEQDDIIHHLIYLYLKKGSQHMHHLKEGYLKMADINLSLCHEFEGADVQVNESNLSH